MYFFMYFLLNQWRVNKNLGDREVHNVSLSSLSQVDETVNVFSLGASSL